jgi:hypothetical protein
MRFVLTVVAAAILLLVLYLLLGWMVDGYFGGNIVPNRFVPDSWAAPNTWAEWRDITIVLTGVFFVLSGILTVILLFVLILLVGVTRRVMSQNVAPAVDSLKETLDNVRGTTEIVGESVVSPIIRVYSVVNGVKTGLSAVTNLPDFIRSRGKKKKKK